jgi:hypothetical protein
MPRSRQPLKCYHCKTSFPRTPGAGLFCGKDCEDAHCAAIEDNRKQLTDAGFVQHPETPNIWQKDGVAVTEEQVKHVGFEKAVQLHASHLAGINGR